MVKIIYNKLRERAKVPYAATEMSGGLDITAAHIEHISPNDVIVYTGLAMQPPPGYTIRISPRSSFTKYNWVLLNSPCLGDADFQGEYKLRFKAIPKVNTRKYGINKVLYENFPYKVGDRVAQMWVEKIIPIQFEENELINKTDRVGGFGSTN